MCKTGYMHLCDDDDDDDDGNNNSHSLTCQFNSAKVNYKTSKKQIRHKLNDPTHAQTRTKYNIKNTFIADSAPELPF
jgi:hypothetical protein